MFHHYNIKKDGEESWGAYEGRLLEIVSQASTTQVYLAILDLIELYGRRMAVLALSGKDAGSEKAQARLDTVYGLYKTLRKLEHLNPGADVARDREFEEFMERSMELDAMDNERMRARMSSKSGLRAALQRRGDVTR